MVPTDLRKFRKAAIMLIFPSVFELKCKIFFLAILWRKSLLMIKKPEVQKISDVLISLNNLHVTGKINKWRLDMLGLQWKWECNSDAGETKDGRVATTWSFKKLL